MRKILVAVFLLVSLVSFSQEVTSFPTVGLIQFPKTNGIGYRGVGGDSLLWVPSDTIRPAASIVGKAHIAIKNGVLYYWDGSKYAAFSGGGGGSGTVTSVATGYGLAGGTITTTGTLRWDSATGYLTGLRRKDSATGTNLNGYLTRTSVRTYSPGIDDVLAVGQLLTANRTIDLNGGYLYNLYVDADRFLSYDGYTLDNKMLASGNMGEFKSRAFEILGYTEDVSGGTSAKFRSNQDWAEVAATKTATGGNDQASAAAGIDVTGSLAANLVMHPVSSINWGVTVNRAYHGIKIGIGSTTNSNDFKGIRIDSTHRLWLDTAYSGSASDSVLVWDKTTKEVKRRNASAFSGGSTPTFQQTLTAGSTLTGDNTIAGGGHDLLIDNTNSTFINAVSGAITNTLLTNSVAAGITATNGSANYSELGVAPSGITFKPDLGNIKIDSLTSGGGSDSLLGWTSSTGVIRKLDQSKFVSTTGTQTLTNKRWTPRVGSTTSSATPTINTDNVDIYKLTAQAADITSMTTNLSGTPVDGDVLEIQITGTAARAITWGTSFVSSTVTLPTTTVTTATLTVILQYYTTSSYGNNKWVCVNYY